MESVSKVYFITVDETDSQKTIQSKLARLVAETKLLDFICKEDKVAIKMHFGEEKNTGYVRPEYVRVICDTVAEKEAQAFLADTNTLYRGRRTNSQDHLKLAFKHGFTYDIVAAPVVIPDDTKIENVASIEVNQKFIRVAKIAKTFVQADALVGVAHFKGHLMTGFGGALKNVGMGCATRGGKMAQHSDISPFIITNRCIGCGLCAKVCPVKAILIKDKKAHLDSAKCIGCASCIAACIYEAIDVNWEAGGSIIQEKMVEYARAVLMDKKDKCAFFNFALKITKECDCLAGDDPRIAPDIGIFASTDPVSIDQASLDLVIKACGQDIFKEVHPKRDGFKQLAYAANLGLGNLSYELIKL